MSEADLAHRWASQFGLALSPLFGRNESGSGACHSVLLDGGNGSFALTEGDDQAWRSGDAAHWSWSSNLPHHVTISKQQVAVVRWDKSKVELLSRSSVENNTEAFYRYLTTDRVRSTVRVVDHMIDGFRRLRSLLADARIEDSKSVDAFVAFLSQTLSKSDELNLRFDADAGEAVLNDLSQPALSALRDDFCSRSGPFQEWALHPSLAIRHAGAEIFQEAHFELVRAPAIDLFGRVGPAEARGATRGGAHFTPPALARSISEQTLRQIEGIAGLRELIILDPACGSGAFLTEALRALRRTGFEGRVTLHGRDVSNSAISMAEFSIAAARADWEPKGGCQVDLQVADSLDAALPSADLVLMNPPFIAWSALSAHQRDQMRNVLRERLEGRGDFSMAFVTKALKSLRPGGALGTLLPASLLTLQAAEEWRDDILDQSDVRFISSFGDYKLFSYALVQVSALVLRSRAQEQTPSKDAIALLTANDSDATGDALRMLRKSRHVSGVSGEQDSWTLFRMSADTLRNRPSWRLITPKAEQALQRLVDIGGAAPLRDIFEVRQGVRTGMNPVFLLTDQQFAELPKKERAWFRSATMNDSIVDGAISHQYWLFYPYNNEGLALKTEQEVARAVPQYFERILQPNKENLSKRANIRRANRKDWWGISERRASWAFDPRPRLISKYFGARGGFALDLEAQHLVVQGFAWFPRWISENDPLSSDAEVSKLLSDEVLLAAYAALLNSNPFEALLEIFSPHVAGGQYDLSPRYVDAIPIPDFAALSADERAGLAIRRLASLGTAPRVNDPDWINQVDRLAADLFGSDFSGHF